eukprot:scaffold5966_cov118-Cylindrotheca_fusiformis.AAC.10
MNVAESPSRDFFYHQSNLRELDSSHSGRNHHHQQHNEHKRSWVDNHTKMTSTATPVVSWQIPPPFIARKKQCSDATWNSRRQNHLQQQQQEVITVGRSSTLSTKRTNSRKRPPQPESSASSELCHDNNHEFKKGKLEQEDTSMRIDKTSPTPAPCGCDEVWNYIGIG